VVRQLPSLLLELQLMVLQEMSSLQLLLQLLLLH
jgi:hypothetical protein